MNRVFGNFMGRGLVDPVDDVRATNPASNEELFAALSKDFVEHGYDIKHLIRTIMNSTAYQLSSEANATNQDDNKYLLEVHRQAPAGGSAAGCDVAGDRRADDVSRAIPRARARCSCPIRRWSRNF